MFQLSLPDLLPLRVAGFALLEVHSARIAAFEVQLKSQDQAERVLRPADCT